MNDNFWKEKPGIIHKIVLSRWLVSTFYNAVQLCKAYKASEKSQVSSSGNNTFKFVERIMKRVGLNKELEMSDCLSFIIR